VVGQVGLGIMVGTVLYFSPSVTVRTDTSTSDILKVTTETVIQPALTEEKSTATTIPFFKIMNLIMLNY
jgi:phospho-N-acetylmuramoyl-pentapeptide-transferase